MLPRDSEPALRAAGDGSSPRPVGGSPRPGGSFPRSGWSSSRSGGSVPRSGGSLPRSGGSPPRSDGSSPGPARSGRRGPVEPRLSFALPAQPGAPGLARQRLRRWLSALGCPEDLADDLVYAVNEAVTNASEHAYRGREPGLVGVEAALVRDGGSVRVRVRVRDSGRWAPAASDRLHNGRGLQIMAALTHELAVHRDDIDPDGTEVVLLSRALPAGGGAPAGCD